MWSILDSIFANYHGTGYTLAQFVYAFSTRNPRFVLTLSIAGLTFLIGFIEYIYSFLLFKREGSSPFNILMHSYYFAIDSMGIFVFATAAHATNGFWLFTAASIAEVVWTLFEIYSLVKCVTAERQAIWGTATTASQAAWKVLGWVVVMVTCVNLFRVFLNDPAMFKWYIFTNVLMAIMPGLYWEKRGTRIGASWGLSIVILIGTVNSFLPNNMWSLASPYFSMANNPWFYVVGIVAIFFACRNLWVMKHLPPKPKVLANGKHSIW